MAGFPVVAAPAKPQPPMPQITDAILIMSSGLAYPDQHRLDETYGTVSAVYHVGGHHTFKDGNSTEDVSLDLTVTFKCQLNGRH